MASGSGDPLFSGVNITSILPAPEKSVFQRGGEIKEKNLNILRIAGIVSHNEECCKQIMQRLPAIPLHEHVWQIAIEQLEQGASITEIQARNRELCLAKAYHGQSEWNPATANVRYELLPSDSRSLYRQFSRRLGVDITREAQYNIDDWLNKDSSNYKPEIAAAVFYYQGPTWKYTHQKQLILDGTFGICDRRVLLFIALGVDENNKGVPLAFFLFSAPTGNRATHAGYDTDILHELLVQWQDSLGKKDGVAFAPCVAITDTDTKERVLDQSSQKEEQLIISINYVSATQIVDEERSALTQLKSLPDMDIAVTAGLAHIKYLTETWMPVSLWHSWSQKGHLTASEYLKTTIEGVIPTTNHLEAFNGVLKRKHIHHWQRAGKRVRIDLLIFLLITKILPGIYQYRTAQEEYKGWVAARFRDQAGGVDLLANRKAKLSEQSITSTQSDIQSPIVWWPDNRPESAIEEANYIVEHGRFDYIRWTDAYTIMGTCASRTADICDPGHMRYNLWITTYGMASCSCLAVARGVGACKHLWALRIKIKKLTEEQKIHPGYPFLYPVSMEEAKHIYNVHYPRSSHPSQQDPIPTPTAIILPPDTASELAINSTSTSQNIGALNLVSVQASLLLVGTAEVIETNNPADMEDLDTESSSSECEIDCNNTQKFNGDVRNGIAIQLQERVSHATQNILPRVLSFSDLLAQMVYQNIPVDVIDEIPELLAVTSRIHAQLGMVSDSQISVQAVQATYSNIPKPLPSFPLRVADSTGRIKTSTQLSEKRPLLLPPSPESKQRRKTSHGIR
ncbi:hypothetical protein M422DRAFT_261473 [Sphaerobolus stellatus SS14]|uniref:SWIM-type domain-containing protein n=1 Tax=Sphaerobolus stellatus (strain SS14) TaxID=990650 RepID=A0A0C9VFF1_SPHS4|nr:hypothetical protein M422DRAFT_261473 [Sphaerobolus stellatus SS14]